jgi:hypothetical protein
MGEYKDKFACWTTKQNKTKQNKIYALRRVLASPLYKGNARHLDASRSLKSICFAGTAGTYTYRDAHRQATEGDPQTKVLAWFGLARLKWNFAIVMGEVFGHNCQLRS